MPLGPAINFPKWTEENKHLLKPPVGMLFSCDLTHLLTSHFYLTTFLLNLDRCLPLHLNESQGWIVTPNRIKDHVSSMRFRHLLVIPPHYPSHLAPISDPLFSLSTTSSSSHSAAWKLTPRQQMHVQRLKLPRHDRRRTQREGRLPHQHDRRMVLSV